MTRALAVDPGTQTDPSRIEVGKDDVLEQLGIQRLGGKEKKELRAFAHGLGTRLNVQQVGVGHCWSVIRALDFAERRDVVALHNAARLDWCFPYFAHRF